MSSVVDSENPLTGKFSSIIKFVGLCQIVDKPTKITETSATVLDYIKAGKQVEEKDIVHNNFSDMLLFISSRLKVFGAKDSDKMIHDTSLKNFKH